MTEEHRFPVRVYYEDTDFSGFVYHAAYLKFMERGRTEMLRALGIGHRALAGEGIAFAVRSMTLHFDKPAVIDDALEVVTAVRAATGARLLLEQVVLRGEQVLVRAEVTVVAIRAGGGPARLPQALRALVQAGDRVS